MISYTEALEILAGAVEPLTGSERELQDLGGCATTTDILSRLEVPPFTNAAMDGFAVSAADTVRANRRAPLDLPVVGMAAAGDPPATEPFVQGAVEIMTGAPLPPGCDAVVPVEQVETRLADNGKTLSIRLNEPVSRGHHVRLAGQDFGAGQTVLAGGSRIEPHDIMALAATGTDRLTARPAPRFAVITTGSELTTRGIPSQDGLIRDANGPYLAAFLEHVGATLVKRENVPDSAEQLEKVIETSCNDADIILTTGGVSAGRFDWVPDAVAAAGGQVLFHKVAIRPGKPILFARLANGTLLFGLPGNPIAVAAGIRFFVVPALRMMQGLPPERFHVARNLETFHKRPALQFFGKAHAAVDAEGRLEARLLPGQESFRISPLLQSNCWTIAPEGPDCVEAGDLIEVASLYPTGFLQD